MYVCQSVPPLCVIVTFLRVAQSYHCNHQHTHGNNQNIWLQVPEGKRKGEVEEDNRGKTSRVK